jgi:hypothetical protein
MANGIHLLGQHFQKCAVFPKDHVASLLKGSSHAAISGASCAVGVGVRGRPELGKAGTG